MALEPGTRLGAYEIVSPLGAGGMGEVYRGHDSKLGRDVAIKVLPADFARDDGRAARLRREAHVLARLNHPHIAQVYSFEDGAESPALVMELVEGPTLAARIAAGALPVKEVLRIASEVADALAAAHAQHIVHRDLKPLNIKQREDGTIKVLDFGLARTIGEVASPTAFTVSGEATMAGAVAGTLPYMSPEQLDGLPVDHRTDLWSFGVVLFEMLMQVRPFDAATPPRTILQIMNDPVPAMPGVPEGLQRVVRRCLEKDRSARYATAKDLQHDLDACATALDAPPRDVSSLSLANLRRSPFAWVMLVICVAGVVAAGWWTYGASRRRWAREEAIPQARALADRGEYAAAYQLARAAQRYVADDPALADLWPEVARTLTLDTNPPQAAVTWKPYAAANTAWESLGATPLAEQTLPAGPVRLRVTKDGYAPLEIAAPLAKYSLTLSPATQAGPEVVSIPGGRLSVQFSGIGTLDAAVDAFDIDQHEVTNRQFKAFLAAGGYRNRAYWTAPFVDGSRVLSWEEAMARLVDATGQAGPANWEAGSYPEGADDLPVSGVSWYEAAAYSAFAGRSLPTVYHWFRAANTDDSRFLIPMSNFGGEHALPVRSSQAVGSFGAVDMAGNVREWCLNEATGERYILGGSWADPNYMFTRGQTAPPFDRSSTNGFRTVRYASGKPPERLAAAVTPRDMPAYLSGNAVGDAVFDIYRNLYAMPDAPLRAQVTAVDESSHMWRRERIEFAAVDGERLVAYLFLPRQHAPPFQCVISVPSDTAFRNESGESIRPDTFVLRSGRAILYPIFKGTFERYAGPPPRQPVAIRDALIVWRKELGHSIDYLRTRTDIDGAKLAYLGYSLGAEAAPMLLAFEPRFAAAVLLGGGLTPAFGPLPEANAINFLPRVSLPVLMINGAYDSILPVAQAQLPMFDRLGTSPDRKHHVIVPSGHAVTVPEVRLTVTKEVLNWLEKYLGPT